MLLMRTLVGFLMLGALLTTPLHTRAQDAGAKWVFVPVVDHQQDPPSWAARGLDQLVKSAADAGIPVWTKEEAAAAFEKSHSTERALIGAEDVRTLQRLGESAVRSMAAGDYLTARKQLESAALLYQESPDEFNREVPTVVLDLCLHRALAMLQTSTPVAQVRNQISDCRMRIPLDIEPNLMKHTNPIIRQLLAEVGAELLSQRTGVLEVRGTDGCQLRIDGIDSGVVSHGSLQGRDLTRGKHRVSLVCPQGKARVYMVEVTESTSPLAIDTGIDAAVRSRPFLWMSVSKASGRLDEYAAAVSQALSSASVVLMRQSSDGQTVLKRLSIDGTHAEAVLSSPSQVGEPWSAEMLKSAIERLQRPGAHDPKPVLSDARGLDLAAGVPSPFGVKARRRAYWVLGVGAAFHVTSVALYLRARSLRAADEIEYDRFLLHEPGGPNKFDHPAARLGFAGFLAGLAGNFSLGALYVPLTERYVAGKSIALPILGVIGAGGALLGVGIWQGRLGDAACEDSGPCRAEQDNHTEIALLMNGAAANLFAVAVGTGLIVYIPDRILRRRQNKHNVRLKAAAGTVQLEGSF